MDINKTLTKNELLIKAEGVKDCIKWIEKKLKEEKKFLYEERREELGYGCFEDCGQFYKDNVTKREGRMQGLIDIKVELEKYMKKLKHMSEEV